MKMNRRGFTLVEVLVVVALVGLVIAAVSNSNLFTQKAAQQNALLNEQQDAMRSFMNTIVPHVRAGAGLLTISGGSITTSGPVADVRVRMPNGSVYRFGLEDGSLWVAVDAGAHMALCSRIGQLTVTYDHALQLLDVSIESLSQIPGITTGLPIKLKTTILLRNSSGG